MADFIAREKEFRKLNEKLDDDFKRSTTLSKSEKFKDTRQNPLTNICYDTQRGKHMGPNNHSDRFATYTKEKSANLSSMRKIGGGDCGVAVPAVPTKLKSPISPKKTTPTTTKTNYGNTFNYRAKTLPKAATGLGYIGGAGGAGVLSKNNFERKPQKIGAEAENASRPAPATTNTRKSLPKETLVVYRNDKFTSSSSMDDIIKRSITEAAEHVEEENKGSVTAADNYVNLLPPRAHESTQPMESMAVCGAKSAQKLVNTSSLIRFLKSKVALLEENQARSHDEMSQQKEAYEATLERHKSVTQQLDKALNRNSALTEQLEKTNSQLGESNRRYREQSQECLALKKELETLKRELKQLTLNYTNLEKRYARTKEETEHAQKSCTSMRQGERDLKESFRRETESKNAEIKYLKKQRSDLFNAYKKQLFLIDNLKQQNVCMEQAKMVEFSEKEFSKILEWNLKA